MLVYILVNHFFCRLRSLQPTPSAGPGCGLTFALVLSHSPKPRAKPLGCHCILGGFVPDTFFAFIFLFLSFSLQLGRAMRAKYLWKFVPSESYVRLFVSNSIQLCYRTELTKSWAVVRSHHSYQIHDFVFLPRTRFLSNANPPPIHLVFRAQWIPQLCTCSPFPVWSSGAIRCNSRRRIVGVRSTSNSAEWRPITVSFPYRPRRGERYPVANRNGEWRDLRLDLAVC